MTPIVTVVLPTRNRPAELGAALDSLAAQTLDAREFEVVVVNDGGTDVGPVVERFERVLDVRLVDHDVNRGPSAARNTALDHARGVFVSYLDDDDLLLPHALGTAVAAARRGADFVFCDVAIRTVRDDTSAEANPAAYDLPYDRRFLEAANHIPTIAVLHRRTEARFDPALPVVEDWDMWLRLVRGGARVTHIPAVGRIYHRARSADSLTADADESLAAFRTFYDAYRTVCARWPVPDGSRQARYRDHMILMHEMVCAHLAEGDELPHLYYERILGVLWAGFSGAVDDKAVPELMEAALTTPQHSFIAPGRG